MQLSPLKRECVMRTEFRAWLPDIEQYLYSSTCVAYKFIMHKNENWIECEDGTKIESGPWEQNTGYILPVHTYLYIGDYISNNYGDKNPIIREVKYHYGKIVLERIKGDARTAKIILLDDWKKWHDNNYYEVGNIHQGVNRE